MKRSKIFICTAAVVLSVCGFVSTKANHKFFSFAARFNSINSTGTLTLNSSVYTTTIVSGRTVVLMTTASHHNLGTLVTAAGGTTVYRKAGL